MPALSKFVAMDSRQAIFEKLVWSPTGQIEEGDEKRAVASLERIMVADCYGQVSHFKMVRDAYNRKQLGFVLFDHFSSRFFP